MNSNSKITLAQWNDLSEEGKERLRNWAMQRGLELDLIPGPSGTFDPVCDYAALLTKEQMKTFLQEEKQKVSKTDDMKILWKHIKKHLS
jgi:hypothetical protein